MSRPITSRVIRLQATMSRWPSALTPATCRVLPGWSSSDRKLRKGDVMSPMIRASILALGVVAVAGSVAAEDMGYEFISIGEHANNGSDFGALSLRVPLLQSSDGAERNATTGLRLRLDMTRSSYVTGYNNVVGEGTGVVYRLLLAYGMALSDATTLTLIGGVSKRRAEVRPVTPSSPDDTDETGVFVGAELEVNFADTGNLQVIVEHDATSGNYGSLTYLHDLGAVRIGPTVSMFAEEDYSLKQAGLVAAVDLAEDAELRVTATRGESSLTGFSDEDQSAVQVQFRIGF